MGTSVWIGLFAIVSIVSGYLTASLAGPLGRWIDSRAELHRAEAQALRSRSDAV